MAGYTDFTGIDVNCQVDASVCWFGFGSVLSDLRA
jgi:hypothetical protein